MYIAFALSVLEMQFKKWPTGLLHVSLTRYPVLDSGL